ncbi:MAG: GrpB family protein [Bacilli bacterium]|nr:GrpB family protein [Bacilli bacterium]
MGLINNQVYLENNYKIWKKIFSEEKEKLNKIFSEDNFEIEHVGSTAIENLSAKPIVDIAIGVPSFDNFKKYLNKLSKLYIIKENYENDEILLIKEKGNETFFLIHVIPINCIRYKNMIAFRDILRVNCNILKKYEMLKINLANKYSNNRQMYTKSKNDFINEILKNTN